jgi:hypothetical protein
MLQIMSGSRDDRDVKCELRDLSLAGASERGYGPFN